MATTNTTTKITNKVALEKAIACVQCYAENTPETAEVVVKLQKMLESLEKKNSKSGKPTAKQIANMGLGEIVVSFLRENADQKFTITELMKQDPGLPEEITNQKMTGLFRLESVKPFYERTMDKGKAYFQYKEAEVVEDGEE